MQFSSPIPRPEYPRPDRQRGLVEGIDWINLNANGAFQDGRIVRDFDRGRYPLRPAVIIEWDWDERRPRA